MESGGNFSLCGKAAVIEANLRDDYYWKLVADFVGPQTGEGLDLDRELCKNRLLIQSGLMREDNNFPWISVIDWLKRIFPVYHSADFRCLIERGIATTLSLAGEARQTFLDSYVNFNFVGPICDSIGVERDHLLKMKDFSDRAQSIEVTNGLILELNNFVTRERVSPINLVTWLRNFNPEYCKDGKIQKAYKVLKVQIKKLKMCHHNSQTRSHRRNFVMENLLQSPFELVNSRDYHKTSAKKRTQSSPGEKMMIKEEQDRYEISPSRESENSSVCVSVSSGSENAGCMPDVAAVKKEVILPSLLDVAMLSVQKLSSIHHGQTKKCRRISWDLLRNQYALTCKEHPTMVEFEKILHSVGEQVSLAPPVVFLHHNANFLVDVHDMVEQQIMAFESEITQSRGDKLGRDGNPLFKNVVGFTESATSRFIHMATDMLTPGKGALLSYKKHWLAFCKEKKNPSRLVRRQSTLFSSYFEAAAGLIHHHNEVAPFFSDMLALNDDECPNVLLESVVADASDSVIQSIVCVLAIIYCKVVGPYWQLLKSTGEYSLFSQYLLCLYQKFLEWSKDPSTLMVPEKVTNVFLQFALQDKLYNGVYQYCDDLHTNRDLIRVCLKRMIKVIAGVAEEHLNYFLPGGRYAKVPSSDLNMKLLNCKFAVLMADYPYSTPPGQKDKKCPTDSDSSEDLSSSDVEDHIDGQTPNAASGAHWVKGRGRQKMVKRPAIKAVISECMDLDYITATVDRNGGPCRTQQDVDKLLLRLADSDRQTKCEAIRCEIAFQKMVLHNTDPILNSNFRTTTDMTIKLKLSLPRLKPGYSIVLAPRKTAVRKCVRPSMESSHPKPEVNQQV
ncbi:uncharacterized protein LOC109518340 [Hippocampus comes]|uniref:uncharacterized protein LOC109518340 n=1 Tax=Hippocampus comes TaxID=109280 RepID=UPI00094E4DD8|nr:PREDICTED: uncharacterized protein LOC109518340 [Hippocampus comes]